MSRADCILATLAALDKLAATNERPLNDFDSLTQKVGLFKYHGFKPEWVHIPSSDGKHSGSVVFRSKGGLVQSITFAVPTGYPFAPWERPQEPAGIRDAPRPVFPTFNADALAGL